MSTMTAPSVTDFLAQPADAEDLDDSADAPAPTPADLVPLASDPLASIAASLGKVAAAVEVALDAARREATASDQIVGERDRLRERLADLESKHGLLLEVVAEVEETVKPSVSKLANSVREVLERWSAPDQEPQPTDQLAADQSASEQAEVIDPFAPPAADAGVEEWRAWARRVKGVQDGEAAETDAMNRSQIRTALGVAQPVSAGTAADE